MAISDFFLGSIREFAYGNWPVSMACACTCLDATSKNENGGGERKSREVGPQIKSYINKYLDVITVVGTGGAVCANPGSRLCLSDPEKPGSHSPIEDIIYRPIRNSLIHDAELATEMQFTERAFLGYENKSYLVSINMIVSLLMAVTASPSNKGMGVDTNWQVILNGRPIPFDRLMGDPVAVRTWLGLIQ
jgi:hypothetical protein